MESIQELVRVADLDDVVHYEIRGVLVPERPEDFEANSYRIDFAELVRPEDAFARYRLAFEAEDANYLVDVGAHYSFSEPVTFDRADWVQFAEEVAFMVVFPFLREAVFSAAARLGRPAPVLGLMKRGEFRIESKEDTGAQA
ncbi:hypothetical protein C5C71_06430 [Rathayibacter sp. AY1C1]|uniref:hypothetical protein n=1 Tax=Rathayibacter sp. AY1C1 TaxID=2080534 RepID=UPI000CE78DCF|nr:hypothetical protein [Rathayibacter sp. AY1C1]PPH11636.1 hypothetical protein C5C71_06430 [Rathayibacter sp. AY1C1]